MSKMNPRPNNAKTLQLFSTMKGAGAAAREIGTALSKARKQVRADINANLDLTRDWTNGKLSTKALERVLSRILYRAWNGHVQPALNANSKFGATDTEPRQTAQQWLVDDVKEKLNISSDFWLLVW